MSVESPTLYPDKQYIISKIQGVLRYSSDNALLIEIQNHEGKDITIEELADQYYTNPEDYFEQANNNNNNTSETGVTFQQQGLEEEDHKSEAREGEIKNYSAKTDFTDEFFQNSQIANEFH